MQKLNIALDDYLFKSWEESIAISNCGGISSISLKTTSLGISGLPWALRQRKNVCRRGPPIRASSVALYTKWTAPYSSGPHPINESTRSDHYHSRRCNAFKLFWSRPDCSRPPSGHLCRADEAHLDTGKLNPLRVGNCNLHQCLRDQAVCPYP